MMWLRVVCGLFFLVWVGCMAYVAWVATRSLPDPNDWKSDKGQLDPNSEEFRRLIQSR